MLTRGRLSCFGYSPVDGDCRYNVRGIISVISDNVCKLQKHVRELQNRVYEG